MPGRRLPLWSNVVDFLGIDTPQSRSYRDIEQSIAALETSEEEEGLRLAGRERTVVQLGAEIDILESGGDEFEQSGDEDTVSSARNPVDLGPPSLPIEESVEGDLPECAGSRFVDQLPDIDLKDLPKDNTSCNICMNAFHFGNTTDDSESPVRLPGCGHVMGRKCISQWLTTSNSCPLCRHVLFRRVERPSPFGALRHMIARLEVTELVDVAFMMHAFHAGIVLERLYEELGLGEVETGNGNGMVGLRRAREMRALLREHDGLGERLAIVRQRVDRQWGVEMGGRVAA